MQWYFSLPKKVSETDLHNVMVGLGLFIAIWTPFQTFANVPQNQQNDEIESILVTQAQHPQSDDPVNHFKKDTLTVLVDVSSEDHATYEKVSYSTLLSQSETLRSDAYVSLKQTEVLVPVSIENLEEHVDVLLMSDQDRGRFIARKQKWLNRFARFLIWARKKPAKINAILDNINDQMFRSAKAIGSANGVRVTSTPAISIGVGLPNWFMKWLKSHPRFANLPDHAGFYLFLSTGITIVRAKYDGKVHWTVRPIGQIRVGRNVFSPYSILTAGVPTGIGYVNHDQAIPAFEKFNFVKVSIPTLVKGPREFFVNLPFGISFTPPLTSSFAGISGDVYQYSLNPSHFPILIASIKKYFSARKMRCAYVLR